MDNVEWTFEVGLFLREFYDLREDPYQQVNGLKSLSDDSVALLHEELDALFRCKGVSKIAHQS